MSGVLIEKETEILAIILGGAMQHKNTHTHMYTQEKHFQTGKLWKQDVE